MKNLFCFVSPQSPRCQSHRPSWPLSAPPTCGSSWTPTPSTETAPSSTGRWSTARCRAPCMTCSPWTRPRTRSATWTQTPSTRSAFCWPDLWKGALGPQDLLWEPGPDVQVRGKNTSTRGSLGNDCCCSFTWRDSERFSSGFEYEWMCDITSSLLTNVKYLCESVLHSWTLETPWTLQSFSSYTSFIVQSKTGSNVNYSKANQHHDCDSVRRLHNNEIRSWRTTRPMSHCTHLKWREISDLSHAQG